MLRVTGKGPNILAADASFQAGRQHIGEALTIALTEPADSKNRWTIVVEASIAGGGFFVVGSFVTRPPRAGPPAVGTLRSPGGDPANRIVAECYVPGVKSWKIYMYGPRGASAQVALASGTRALSGNQALVLVNGSQSTKTRWSPSPNTGAKTQQGVATAGPGSVLEGYGYTDPAFNAIAFFGFVDKATPIVNGDLFTVAPFPIPILGAILAWNFGDAVADGLRFDLQARWVTSTTDNVVTLGIAPVMRVQNKVV